MEDSAVKGTIAEPVLTMDEAFKLGCILVEKRKPIMFVGPPGVGKTSLCHQIAKAVNGKIKVSHPVVDSPLDYKGHPFGWLETQKNGKKEVTVPKATFIPYGDLQVLIEAEGLLIYVGDDLGQATDTVKASWMQLMLARHINGHAISDHVVFIACSNRKEDAAGVTRFLEPLKDRFHTIITIKPDFESWKKWALQNQIAYEVIDWIRRNPKYLDGFKPASDFSRTPTPRSIEQLSDLYQYGLPESMQLRCFAGCVGPEAAVNFMGHLQYFSRIPDPDRVIADPKGVKLPSDPVLLWALTGALVAKASKKTIEPILTVAERFTAEGLKEFSHLLIQDSILRNKTELMGNLKFCQWAAEHQEQLGL